MRRIQFDPSDYPNWTQDQKNWWDAWSARAQRARDDLLAANMPRRFKSEIWRDLKVWLLENFFGDKCAYCEINITGGFFGEGEHYRPKGSVRVAKDGKLSDVTQPDGKAHPGYYWMAYDATNLLPSCDKCNNHKTDQFPVSIAHVVDPPAAGVDIEAAEGPLLVHPCRDDPGKHLKFGLAGVVAGMDDRGLATIEVFDLARSKLAELRKARQEEAETAFALALSSHLALGIPLSKSMEPYVGLKAPFSAAVGDHLRARKAALIAHLQD